MKVSAIRITLFMVIALTGFLFCFPSARGIESG